MIDSTTESLYSDLRRQVTAVYDEVLRRYLDGNPPYSRETLAEIKARGLTFEDWKLKWRVVLKQAKLEAGQRQLDVGCGAALLAVGGLQNGADYYGLDLSASTLAFVAREAARRGINNVRQLAVAEARHLPYPGGFFDVVTAVGFSEYWPFDYLAAALREMARVLAPGGRLIFDALDGARSGSDHSRQIEALRGLNVYLPTYGATDEAFDRAGLRTVRTVGVERRVVYNLVKV